MKEWQAVSGQRRSNLASWLFAIVMVAVVAVYVVLNWGAVIPKLTKIVEGLWP